MTTYKLKGNLMRLLNKSEAKLVGGGQRATLLAPAGAGAQFFSNNSGRYHTTVSCSPGSALVADLGMGMTGKLVNMQTGAQYSAPINCTITTSDQKTGFSQVTTNGVTQTFNEKKERVSEASNDGSETGLAQLAEVTGLTEEELAAELGANDDGGGWTTLPNLEPPYNPYMFDLCGVETVEV